MFKWNKMHGCGCTPLLKNGEKYILTVGDVFCGIVQTLHELHDTDTISWSADFQVCGKSVGGMSGGELTRDECMAWVEDRVIKNLSEFHSVLHGSRQREIYDAEVKLDKATGEWVQERLE